MELYILTDPRFYYYAFSWVFFAIASSSCLIYLVPYGQSIGLDEMKASSLISALMCGEMVSRCIYGVFMDRTTKTQRFTICASVTLCTSLIFLVLPHLRSYYALMGGCVVLGMSSGGLDGLYSIFIVDLFGLKLYTAAFGYSNIPIHGLGMLSTIMIGKFVDVTGDLTLVFYVGSASAFLSVCVCLKMLQSVRSASQAEEENKISDDHSLL
uniref:Major facilitator superfamily (MFS) profile domain-containing protein n=1 Tax=Ciona savignyi TaxID=51511 RepID=H2YBM4_CIOSA